MFYILISGGSSVFETVVTLAIDLENVGSTTASGLKGNLWKHFGV
jgi:aspartyl aminopeptidase